MTRCSVYIQSFDYGSSVRGERKKAESLNGLTVLNHALQEEFGEELSHFTIEKGVHGKPYFADSDICFNISHSGNYAAAAVSSVPVGVDVQVVRPVKDNIIAKLCRGKELEYINNSVDKSRAFIRLWALKESYIKATGDGMSFPMDEINFDITGFDGAAFGKISNRGGLYSLRYYDDFVLAVCCLSDKPDIQIDITMV